MPIITGSDSDFGELVAEEFNRRAQPCVELLPHDHFGVGDEVVDRLAHTVLIQVIGFRTKWISAKNSRTSRRHQPEEDSRTTSPLGRAMCC